MGNPEYLVMKGICKGFGGTQALQDVDFSAVMGEVHAISGENGAGKSTLVKILSGALPCDKGEIFMDGNAHNAWLAATCPPKWDLCGLPGIQPDPASNHCRKHFTGTDANHTYTRRDRLEKSLSAERKTSSRPLALQGSTYTRWSAS